MEAASSPILEGLNPAQREAVVHYDVPSLIIAGAGSGKTRVLTSRIAYMIEQGVEPFRILALTFTNKAAEQMRTRIAAMVPGNRSRQIRMGTFHSVFSRILRENADRIGFPQTFTIYEPNDVKNLLKTIVRELHLDDAVYKPGLLASRISFAKNCLVTPGAYLARAACAAEDRQLRIPEFGNIYNLYCRRCKQNGAMDFDDLLLQTNILLRDCPDVLENYQKLFQYILVDEYQDTNYAQYMIIRRLSALHARVCVVGDDAQSIYSFRGAKIENILSFQQDFPQAMVFKLEQNYRSTRTIVDAANSVIVKNARRMEKHCFSEGDAGEKIRILRAFIDRDEAEQVVKDLRNKIRTTESNWSDVVILYRTNNQSKEIEDCLIRYGIPYRIYKGNSFYNHKEIMDLIYYFRLIINPLDDEAFKQTSKLIRGLGDTTVSRIEQLANEQKVSMWELANTLLASAESETDTTRRAIIRKIKDFVLLIRSLSLLRTELSLYDFGMSVATRSGILPSYREDYSPDADLAVDRIEQLLNSMRHFNEQVDAEIRNGERPAGEKATIEEWLQNTMLLTDMDKDNDTDDNKVTLMTVHSAKGLEYDYVYIIGVEEDLFPSQRASQTAEGLEEERRLFYVALTRAKIDVTLSFADQRFKWGDTQFTRPSRFLYEIDPDFVEGELPKRNNDDEKNLSAVDRLRRQFDYRYRQPGSGSTGSGYRPPRAGGAYGSGGSGGSGRAGASGGSGGSGGGFPQRTQRTQQQPDPALVQPVRSSTEGMRRLGVRPKEREEAAPVVQTAGGSGYAVGDRVSHTIFGIGVIKRIEVLNGDQKLVVDFGRGGEKTLLTRLAKLTKL